MFDREGADERPVVRLAGGPHGFQRLSGTDEAGPVHDRHGLLGRDGVPGAEGRAGEGGVVPVLEEGVGEGLDAVRAEGGQERREGIGGCGGLVGHGWVLETQTYQEQNGMASTKMDFVWVGNLPLGPPVLGWTGVARVQSQSLI